jgi:hypothetical protein
VLKACFRLGLLLVLTASWAHGQQTSALVGTWVGKVQGYGVEMKLVLNVDGSADFEGAAGRWRVQDSKLLLTQEGETVEGDEGQGVISVTYPNGETKELQYRRSGTDLNVGGRTYARYGDGSCSKRSPVYE